jgi:hypothetical protein
VYMYMKEEEAVVVKMVFGMSRVASFIMG